MKRALLAASMFCSFSLALLAGPEAPGEQLPARQGLIGALFAMRPADSDRHVLVVSSVLALSPAFRKLHSGDVIAGVNGSPAKDPLETQRLLRRAVPGDQLRIQVAGASPRVVTLTVAQLTPEWAAKLAAAEDRMQREARAEGRLGHIPQTLCYSGGGGEFLGLTALVGLAGAAAIESVQPDCREVFRACSPLTVLDQDEKGTTVRAGGRKYHISGDWRELTFDTAAACSAALSSGAAAPGKGSSSSTWSAASQ